MNRISILLLAAILILLSNCSPSKSRIQVVENDAAWCWFSDPRAIYLNSGADSGSMIVGGGVTSDGSIVAFSYDGETNLTHRGIIHSKLEIDDHNNPSFLELPDGHLLAFYGRHHNSDMYMARTSLPGEITEWEEPVLLNPANAEEAKIYGESRYTYANPFMLSQENNRIYLFGRWSGFKPTMTWSDDNGVSWSDSRVVISADPFDPGNRPYVKYYSDGTGRIHMTFTDGHPRKEPENSVYYVYYENDAFFRADGTMICTVEDLPFEPGEATVVYDATEAEGRAWVYDIKADEAGRPVIAYARYPGEKEHLYHYVRFDGTEWSDLFICDSGKWFPQTPEGENEREPHYSGGLTIDGSDVATVYLSRQVEGIFEIEKWQLRPGGGWVQEAVTQGSGLDQVRPVVPWHASTDAPDVLWMENEKYIHYTDFKTRVKMLR